MPIAEWFATWYRCFCTLVLFVRVGFAMMWLQLGFFLSRSLFGGKYLHSNYTVDAEVIRVVRTRLCCLDHSASSNPLIALIAPGRDGGSPQTSQQYVCFSETITATRFIGAIDEYSSFFGLAFAKIIL